MKLIIENEELFRFGEIILERTSNILENPTGYSIGCERYIERLEICKKCLSEIVSNDSEGKLLSLYVHYIAQIDKRLEDVKNGIVIFKPIAVRKKQINTLEPSIDL